MAMKKIRVEISQGLGFKTECKAGSHTVVIDQPMATGGTDAGPTPLDYQLITLGGCLAAIGRIIANQRQLPIRGMKITVEGELDTDRLLGKTTQARAGFSAIKATVDIDANLSREEKDRLLREIDERCPISDNLQNPASIQVVLAT
jgi:putative redox protein